MTNLPTREQIAQAIHDGPGAQAQYVAAGLAPHSWADCWVKGQYLLDAEAVLLLLAQSDTLDTQLHAMVKDALDEGTV